MAGERRERPMSRAWAVDALREQRGLTNFEYAFLSFLARQESATIELLVAACLLLEEIRAGGVCLGDVAQGDVAAVWRVLEPSDAPSSTIPSSIRTERLLASLVDHPLVGSAAVKPVGLTGKMFVLHDGLLFLERHWQSQLGLAEKLHARFGEDDAIQGELLGDIVREVGGQFGASEAQMIAVRDLSRRMFGVLTGGPGTGKTTTMLVYLLVRIRYLAATNALHNKSFFLLAPTGRAARRIRDLWEQTVKSSDKSADKSADTTGAQAGWLRELLGQCQVEVGTVHRVLGVVPLASGMRERLEISAADTVIVDESSMLDLMMFHDLLAALPQKGRLLCIGDRHQLPAVEAGAVFNEICELAVSWRGSSGGLLRGVQRGSSRVDTVDICLRELTEVFRFGGESSLGCFLRQLIAGADDCADSRVDKCSDNCHHTSADSSASSADNSADNSAGIASFLMASHDESLSVRCCGNQFEEELRGMLQERCREYSQAVVMALSKFPVAGHFDGEPNASNTEMTDIRSSVLAQLFKVVSSSVVLSPWRKGVGGVEWINAQCHRYIREELRAHGVSVAGELFPGALVLVAENDYELGVMNGDIGVVWHDGNSQKIFFQQGQSGGSGVGGTSGDIGSVAGFVAISPGLLRGFQLAYAVTVHKSQGSEYDRVMLVLPPRDVGRREGRLSGCGLSRQVVYTGASRARKQLQIVGSDEAIAECGLARVPRPSGLVAALGCLANCGRTTVHP